MFESLVKTLGVALSIWEHHEKTKYIDKLVRLKREYHEEINKPFGSRDNNVLDHLEFELRLLSDAWAAIASLGKPNA